MNRFRTYLRDKRYMKLSFFIVFTATCLAIVYFILKDFNYFFNNAVTGIRAILGALSPLWIGIILAYMFNPIADFFQIKIFNKLIVNKNKVEKRMRISRMLSIASSYMLVILCFIGLIYGFASMIKGELIFESLPKLFDYMVKQVSNYQDNIKNWLSHLSDGPFSHKVDQIATNIMTWVTNNVNASIVTDNIASIVGSIFNFVVAIVVSIYILADKEFWQNCWKKYSVLFLSEKKLLSFENTAKEVHVVLSSFMRGVLLDSLIIALISSIGLSIIGLKFAVFLGIFAGLANIIPYFGPIIGMIPAFIVGIFSGDIKLGIFAIIVLLIVQQIDSNIIYPKVVGNSTGLRPLIVLIAVTVFGRFMGIGGMIIAVPITGILQIFFIKWLKHIEHKKQHI